MSSYDKLEIFIYCILFMLALFAVFIGITASKDLPNPDPSTSCYQSGGLPLYTKGAKGYIEYKGCLTTGEGDTNANK